MNEYKKPVEYAGELHPPKPLPMPNKYYLREDRKAVKPEMEKPEWETYDNSHKWTFNRLVLEWDNHIKSLPALDVDPDYLKRLSTGWFEGGERYEISTRKGWEVTHEGMYNRYPEDCRLTIVAPQEAEKRIGADNICPETKELCLDECCSPGSVCNVSGSKLQPADKSQEDASPFVDKKCIHCGKEFQGLPDGSSYCSITCWDAHCLHGVPHIEQPATPQPVTGEAGDDEAAFNEWESSIPKPMMEVLDELAGHTYPVRGILRRLFRQASRPSDAVEFGDLIEDAVNAYFHQAEKELGRKDLGYIEGRNWQKIKNDCQRFFTNSKSPNPNK